MLNSHLKLFSPKETEQLEYFDIIRNFSFQALGTPVYILDWTYIFQQIDKWKTKKNKFAVMIDVGRGNGMFHIFLEKYYKQGVIGVERQDSTFEYQKFEKLGHTLTNATDICIDFINDGDKFFNQNLDIVFWISAIEHNKIENMKKAVDISMKALKKGGMFVSTWAFAPNTHWNDKIGGTVLNEKDAEDVFNSKWIEKPNFDKIVAEYRSNKLNLNDWHNKRFGNIDIDYIHAGNVCIKD